MSHVEHVMAFYTGDQAPGGAKRKHLVEARLLAGDRAYGFDLSGSDLPHPGTLWRHWSGHVVVVLGCTFWGRSMLHPMTDWSLSTLFVVYMNTTGNDVGEVWIREWRGSNGWSTAVTDAPVDTYGPVPRFVPVSAVPKPEPAPEPVPEPAAEPVPKLASRRVSGDKLLLALAAFMEDEQARKPRG